jgi:hypothetical protein
MGVGAQGAEICSLSTWRKAMTIDEAIAELFQREINCGCETFFDAGIRLWISDPMNDRRAETHFSREHFAESGQWLIDASRLLFPEAFVGPSSKPSV